ncbi:MAG: tetratricopeptide repeat protein [Phycisphaerales bacterium]|nr:tetratricopeptide repeat protein [Phycisphaerales bacterium]
MSKRRRRTKPKTVRRLLLLGVVALLLLGAGVGVFWVRGWQKERQLDRWRSQGLEQFHNGQYPEALDKLSRTLNRRRQDPEALAAFGECRENTPEVGGRHLIEAMKAYEEARALDPTLHETGVRLLRLYLDLDHVVEARDLAPRLRPARLEDATVADAEVLSLEAQAVLQSGDDKGFNRLVDRLLELRQLPFDALARRVAQSSRAGRAAECEELLARVDKALPGDPRVGVLRLVALGATGKSNDAVFHGLCTLFHLDERTGQASQPPTLPDAKTALMVIGLFDMLARPNQAYTMTVAGRHAFPQDETLAAISARRGWERGEFESVIDTVNTGPVPRAAAADMLAFKALSLIDLGRGSDAVPVAAALEAMQGDFRGHAWARAITALLHRETAGPRATCEALQGALGEYPDEPVLSFLTGEALARLDRFDEARDKWREALRSQRSAGWVTPALRGSETLLREGRAVEAADAAKAAAIASSAGPQAIMAWIETESAALQQDLRTRDEALTFLRRVEDLLAARPTDPSDADRRAFDRLELARVVGLARVGRRDDAIKAATALLGRQPPVAPSTLERLAVLSQQESLDLGKPILDAIGPSAAPAVVLSAALELAARGDAEKGEALLRARADALTGAARMPWDQALAQFGELTNRPDALERWRALVAAYPRETDVLRTALAAPSLAKDPALIEQTIARFYEISGSSEATAPSFVQVARARALLSGKVTRRGHQEAVGILYKLIASSPRLVTARELLIQGLCMNDPAAGITPDLPGAMSQIEVAADFASRPSAFLLTGAALMQGARDFERAGKLLRRVVQNGSTPAEARLQGAMMLVQQGNYADAAAPLEQIVHDAGEAPDARALWALAQVYNAARRDGDALALYRRLADAPLSDPEIVVQVAAALTSKGDTALAQRVMERIGAMDLPPSRMAAAQGRFAELTGDGAGAEREYERAVAADPNDSGAWQFLVALHLGAHDTEKATASLRRALAALPDDPQLKILEQRITIAATGDDDIDLAKLRDALALDPSRSRAAAAVAALEAARAAGKLNDLATLSGLADAYQDVLAMQGYVARRLVTAPGAPAAAPAAIAERAMARFPTEPEAARLAVEIAATQERWADMLRAAQTWRQHDRSRPVEADLAIADASLRLGQTSDAIAGLEPLVKSAAATPDTRTSRLILQTYARALVQTHETAHAHDTLLPVLHNPGVRDEVWIPLAALTIPDAGTAEQWLAEAAGTLGPGDRAGRLALARGYATIAGRFPDRAKTCLATAMSTVAGDASAGSVDAIELLGLVQAQAGLRTEAIESLKAALQTEPARPAAVSELCRLLAAAGRSADAVGVAQRAYDARPPDADATLNLARAQLAAADQPEHAGQSLATAVDLFKKAAELAPGNLGIVLDGAGAAERARNPRAAVWFYDRAMALPAPSPDLAATLRNNAAYALYSAEPSREELARARDLAQDAVRRSPVAAHYDTLAHIEAAVGSRQAAMDAYRKALQLEPGFVSARIGLASIMLKSGGQDRSEAAALLDGLTESKLTADQRAELSRVREQLQR